MPLWLHWSRQASPPGSKTPSRVCSLHITPLTPALEELLPPTSRTSLTHQTPCPLPSHPPHPPSLAHLHPQMQSRRQRMLLWTH
jgi:hypothetical protein